MAHLRQYAKVEHHRTKNHPSANADQTSDDPGKESLHKAARSPSTVPQHVPTEHERVAPAASAAAELPKWLLVRGWRLCLRYLRLR